MDALRSTTIAKLFHHYVEVLAPWYDLNDSQALFANVVPFRSLENGILFKALIAFSARHQSKLSCEAGDDCDAIATAFHQACIEELIPALEKVDESLQAEFLAATCLLRSYEILSGRNIMSASDYSHTKIGYKVIHGISSSTSWALTHSPLTIPWI